VEPCHPPGESKSLSLGKVWGLPGRGFLPEETIAGWIAAIQVDTAVPVELHSLEHARGPSPGMGLPLPELKPRGNAAILSFFTKKHLPFSAFVL
jgi:hypothetical protein